MLHKDQLKEDGVFTEVRFYGCVSKITMLQIATYNYVHGHADHVTKGGVYFTERNGTEVV